MLLSLILAILGIVPNKMPLSKGVLGTIDDIRKSGGKPYVVGGAVRDWLMKVSPKDIDLEVYGVKAECLEEALAKGGAVDFVGKAFGVYKLRRGNEEFDVSLPRRDSKKGSGHRDFDVSLEHDLSPEDASRRRDFTINSMFYDPLEGLLFDPHRGAADLEAGVLRHVSGAFADDPLRVLRGVQFSARFGFDLHPETEELCQDMRSEGGISFLAKERVLEEIRKFVVKGSYHVKGFSNWERTGWLSYFPELENLRSTIQDSHWHPEGDVLTHTGFALQALHKIPQFQQLGEDAKFVVGLGVMCHDMGKPETTAVSWSKKLQMDVVSSHNHQIEGVPVGRRFLERLGVGEAVTRQVEGLILYHMDHLWTKERKDVRRLAYNLSQKKEVGGGGGSIFMLSLVAEADHSGRPPLFPGQAKEMERILSLAEEEGCLHHPPQPLLGGTDLIQLGIPQGKLIGLVLEETYSTQINRGIKTKEEALDWAKNNLRQIGQKVIPPSVGGRQLQDLGCEDGPAFSIVLDDAYLMQLRGIEIGDSRLLREFKRHGGVVKIPQPLPKGVIVPQSKVSSSHDIISRDR